ncbi:hypothetical protein ADUPG1_009053, partial [Aduncisulcus paluster]
MDILLGKLKSIEQEELHRQAQFVFDMWVLLPTPTELKVEEFYPLQKKIKPFIDYTLNIIDNNPPNILTTCSLLFLTEVLFLFSPLPPLNRMNIVSIYMSIHHHLSINDKFDEKTVKEKDLVTVVKQCEYSQKKAEYELSKPGSEHVLTEEEYLQQQQKEHSLHQQYQEISSSLRRFNSLPMSKIFKQALKRLEECFLQAKTRLMMTNSEFSEYVSSIASGILPSRSEFQDFDDHSREHSHLKIDQLQEKPIEASSSRQISIDTEKSRKDISSLGSTRQKSISSPKEGSFELSHLSLTQTGPLPRSRTCSTDSCAHLSGNILSTDECHTAMLYLDQFCILHFHYSILFVVSATSEVVKRVLGSNGSKRHRSLFLKDSSLADFTNTIVATMMSLIDHIHLIKGSGILKRLPQQQRAVTDALMGKVYLFLAHILMFIFRLWFNYENDIRAASNVHLWISDQVYKLYRSIWIPKRKPLLSKRNIKMAKKEQIEGHDDSDVSISGHTEKIEGEEKGGDVDTASETQQQEEPAFSYELYSPFSLPPLFFSQCVASSVHVSAALSRDPKETKELRAVSLSHIVTTTLIDFLSMAFWHFMNGVSLIRIYRDQLVSEAMQGSKDDSSSSKESSVDHQFMAIPICVAFPKCLWNGLISSSAAGSEAPSLSNEYLSPLLLLSAALSAGESLCVLMASGKDEERRSVVMRVQVCTVLWEWAVETKYEDTKLHSSSSSVAQRSSSPVEISPKSGSVGSSTDIASKTNSFIHGIITSVTLKQILVHILHNLDSLPLKTLTSVPNFPASILPPLSKRVEHVLWGDMIQFCSIFRFNAALTLIE